MFWRGLFSTGQMGTLGDSKAAAWLLLALAVGAATAVHGSLMAIDLGSEYLKVCLVKPGRTPISVVVNEMSKRKSPALVGLVGEDRVIGEEAFSLAIRYPNNVYSQLRNLLGHSAEDAEVQRLLQDSMLSYKVVDHPLRGTCAIQVNETTAYLAEELAAGIFQNAKKITDAQAGESVVDTVIAVPVWMGIAQRQAIMDAARLAGLNVLGLVNTHAAAALQFGIERDFTKKEQTVILYEMGSGSTQAALVKYSTYGKSKSSQTNQFEVLDVAWDHSLGSNSLDLLLLKHFADEFKQKGGDDISSSPKALAKLRRQVRRTKEILSANTAAPITVEELHAGKDFQSSIKRSEFEELAGAFWDRAAAPLTTLLTRNKLKPGDVDAVELLGGGSRVPKLQAVLSEALGGRHLDRHLDADEAVVLGAGLFAANLSSSFRLRKFGMTDHAAFGVSFESNDLFVPAAEKKAQASKKLLDADDSSSNKPGHVLKSLLPAGKKLPIKRAVKYNNLTIDGFSFELLYNASGLHGLPPGVQTAKVAQYSVSGIQGAIKRYNHSGVTALRFEADYSGLIHFTAAECLVEVEVVEDKVIEVPDNSTTNSTDASSKDGKAEANKGGKEAGEDKDEASKAAAKDENDMDEADKEKDDAKDAKADANVTATPKMIKKTIQVTRKKTYHVNLNVSGPGMVHPPLDGEVLKAAEANVSNWVVAEKIKAATAKAKNDLETYIINTREKLEVNEQYLEVTTEDERVKFTEQLSDAEDWLYGDGETADAAAFTDKLKTLESVGSPIAVRATELELRPEVLTAVKERVEAAEKTIASWSEEKPWITEEETKSASEKLDAFKSWLKEQEEAQGKKKSTEQPAFMSADVVTKWTPAEKAVLKLDKKSKPKPPPAAKTEKSETDSSSDDAQASKDHDADKEATADGDRKTETDSKTDAKAEPDLSDSEEELPTHEEL